MQGCLGIFAALDTPLVMKRGVDQTVSMPRQRIVGPQAISEEEVRFNFALRPQRFAQYIGQPTLVRKLQIAVTAAQGRGEPVEHILLHGPPGLGKTTLAHIIANEMNAQVHVTNGPAITKGADLAGILTKLNAGDVLFIDEIHRLPAVVEEYLYPAMEDFKVDVTIDSGMHARTITMPLKPFTLIGATTRIGLLTGPMRSRFSIPLHIEFYTPESLQQILRQNAALLKMDCDEPTLAELARRSRGTPRVANRLLRRVRDFAAVEKKTQGEINLQIAREALDLEGIDDKGLDALDRTFLETLIKVYHGGPAGIEALAATMGEEVDTLVDVVEPFLLKEAFLTRTRQGRCATESAYKQLKVPYVPARNAEPPGGLFNRVQGESGSSD